MEWTQIACLLAGCFLGSFLMTVYRNNRQHRREQEAMRLASWNKRR